MTRPRAPRLVAALAALALAQLHTDPTPREPAVEQAAPWDVETTPPPGDDDNQQRNL